LTIHLGSEKGNTKPSGLESEARIWDVKKGIKKVGKWLAKVDLQSIRTIWQEPSQTYARKQKREVLDGPRV